MLGDKIKNLRREKQLTQVELSTKLGIAQSTLGMIESNKRPAGRKTLLKLADFFGVTIDYLLADDENSKNENVVVPKEYTDRYIVTKKDKEQYAKEMKKANEAFFLDDELSDEAKKEMLDLMSELFWKAKALNKKRNK